MSSDLVTGGAGFIGSHLVRQLRDRGRAVRVLDPLAEASRFGEGVEAIAGSALDEATVARTMAGVDTVYHLAANPQLWAPDKSVFDQVNVETLRTVLRVAEDARPRRIVFTSSETVLKDYRSTDTAPMREPEDLPPETAMAGPYSRSKRAADVMAMRAARDGAPVVVVCPTLPVGPGDVGLTPPTRMILDYLLGATPAYLETDFNFIAVEDVAAGHILAAERGAVGGRYILGHENMSMSEFLEQLATVADIRVPRFRVPYAVALAVGIVSEFLADRVTRRPPKAPLEGVRLARTPMPFDCAKARDELGLRPTPVLNALARSVDWLIETGRAPQARLRPDARPLLAGR